MSDLEQQCAVKLENLGDVALNTQRHDEAIKCYSVALSLSPPIPQRLYVQRSKARADKGLWRDALNDADEVRVFIPISASSQQ